MFEGGLYILKKILLTTTEMNYFISKFREGWFHLRMSRIVFAAKNS